MLWGSSQWSGRHPDRCLLLEALIRQAYLLLACSPCTQASIDIRQKSFLFSSCRCDKLLNDWSGVTYVSLQEARILNHATWSPLAVLGHPGSITSPEDAVVYKEVADISNAVSQVPNKAAKSHYIVCQLPVKVTQQKVPLDKPNVRLGVGELLPSPSSSAPICLMLVCMQSPYSRSMIRSKTCRVCSICSRVSKVCFSSV